LGLAVEQGYAKAQLILGKMKSTGAGGAEDHVEARRLSGLAAEQGDAEAQLGLGDMCVNGQGGPRDHAEARRLFAAVVRQGGQEGKIAQEMLDRMNREAAAAERRALAIADELIAAEEAEKARSAATRSKSKSAKGKRSVKLPGGGSGGSNELPACGAGEGRGTTAGAAASATADAALRQSIEMSVYEGLVAALEAHGASATEAMRAEARAARDKLRAKRKNQSQKLRRAHATAMEALAALQSARGGSDAGALRLALARAESHAAALPGLEEEASAARERLDALALLGPPAVAAAQGSAELCLGELLVSTADFAEERVIGRGGFGKVFLGEPILRLQRQRVAVKRADLGKLELSDLEQEVAILRMCAHPHLLKLVGFCLEPAAACLVFPLMVGGSLQTRLDLQPFDVEYLRRMGQFASAPPKQLTWRQKLRIVCEAVEALLYLHTPMEGKGCTWHRDFKPANILLDADLNAFLGDTGFAKAAHKSGDRGGTKGTTSVWGGAGSQGYCEDALRPPDEQTEAFAVGVTLLVVLTGFAAVDIQDECCAACEEGDEGEADDDEDEGLRFEDIAGSRLAQHNAGWPRAVADELKQLYTKLTKKPRIKRLVLPKALMKLQSLLQVSPAQDTALDAAGVGPSDSAGASSAAAQPYVPSPLTLQVRAMRPATADPVKKHVIDAFHSLMQRLGQQYSARDAEAPPRGDFRKRLHFWHEECGMPSDVHDRMQKLRIWRNAADKHDDAKWDREGGPRSRDAAEQYLAQLTRSEIFHQIAGESL